MSNDTQIAAHIEAVKAYARATYYCEHDEIEVALAAVEASARQLLEQPGFVMVPVEPTEEMISAGFKHVYHPTMENDMEHVWSAMLESAPTEPLSDAEERAEFEAWAQERDSTHGAKIVSDALGLDYPLGRLLWEAWQARASKGTPL